MLTVSWSLGDTGVTGILYKRHYVVQSSLNSAVIWFVLSFENPHVASVVRIKMFSHRTGMWQAETISKQSS